MRPMKADRYVAFVMSAPGKNFAETVREAMKSVIPKASRMPARSFGRLFPDAMTATPPRAYAQAQPAERYGIGPGSQENQGEQESHERHGAVDEGHIRDGGEEECGNEADHSRRGQGGDDRFAQGEAERGTETGGPLGGHRHCEHACPAEQGSPEERRWNVRGDDAGKEAGRTPCDGRYKHEQDARCVGS